MATPFPYVEIPATLFPIFGERVGDTRVYMREGAEEETAAWHDAISVVAGPSVSPGGVLMYCPVSRAAVYKRMKEGKLTAFNYYVNGRKTRFFGGLIVYRQMPYCYIPISEAKAWRNELEERAIEMGKITREELEKAQKSGEWVYEILKHGHLTPEDLQGEKPDRDAFFLERNSKWQREQKKKTGGRK
jgi:hypothetical protein